MKNKNILFIILSIVIILVTMVIIKEVIPTINEKNYKTRVFKEMQKKSADVIRGVVGIITENTDGSSHKGIGSGVIFDKKDNTYYVITAKHVINVENSKYKIFTKDTEFSGQTIKANDNVKFDIPDNNYYESLLDGKIEYTSDTNDLAILSFQYDGNLTVLKFETNKLKKDDKVMVVGHPEGERYKITYGYIKSGLKTVNKDKVIEHNSYMKQGNSGGVALSKNMKIAGINISGSFTLFGHFVKGYMIPYDIVEENIKEFKSNKKENNDSNKTVSNWSKEKVKMNIKNITKDKTGATLIIEDKNAEPTFWDNNYTIQKLSEADVWYDVKSNPTMKKLMETYTPDENGHTEIKLDWQEMYGTLKKGTYRIVISKNFMTLYSETFKI